MTEKEEFQTIWTKAITKAWSDPSFKKQLLQHPKQTLESMGAQFSKNTNVHINENTEETCYLTLPQQPSEKLSEEALLQLAAGKYIINPWG